MQRLNKIETGLGTRVVCGWNVPHQMPGVLVVSLWCCDGRALSTALSSSLSVLHPVVLAALMTITLIFVSLEIAKF